MARKKNAITKYEIAKIVETGEPSYLRLAKYIEDVTVSANDETEETGYYDGDGTVATEVTGAKYGYDVSGYRDLTDEAQNLIVEMRHETGEGRKLMLKVTKPDGTIETGEATVSNIIDGGGQATEYAPFSCTITRNSKPEVTATGDGSVTPPETFKVTLAGDAVKDTDYTISGASDLDAVVDGTELTITAINAIVVNSENVEASGEKKITITEATTLTINKSEGG